MSILFPLPQVKDLDDSIALASAISVEQLAFAVDQTKLLGAAPGAPFIVPGFNGKRIAANDFSSTNLISVRIDPCFKQNFSDSCSKQIRLVWQPLALKNSNVEAVDGAVHTFYNVSDKDFSSLLNRLEQINFEYKALLNSKQELDLNPVLAQLGYQSEYYKNLKNILIETIKRSSLSRIAIMELHVFGESWDFFAVDFDKNS